MNDDLRALYEEVILEHNRHPRHYPKNPRGSTHHGEHLVRKVPREVVAHGSATQHMVTINDKADNCDECCPAECAEQAQ